jgi:hypothetical protein
VGRVTAPEPLTASHETGGVPSLDDWLKKQALKQAKAFYLGHGFIESPIEPMTLMLSLAQTAA